MNGYETGGLIVAVIILVVVLSTLRRRPRRLKPEHFQRRWAELQKLCADRKTWYTAIIDADELLDEALKRRRYKGKSTGERLVSAQHSLSSNDTVWFGHKLRNRIVQENYRKLSKQDTLEALGGFRQALKDLGALKNGSDQKPETK